MAAALWFLPVVVIMPIVFTHEHNDCQIHHTEGPEPFDVLGALNGENELRAMIAGLIGRMSAHLDAETEFGCVERAFESVLGDRERHAIREARKGQQAAAVDASGPDPRAEDSP